MTEKTATITFQATASIVNALRRLASQSPFNSFDDFMGAAPLFLFDQIEMALPGVVARFTRDEMQYIALAFGESYLPVLGKSTVAELIRAVREYKTPHLDGSAMAAAIAEKITTLTEFEAFAFVWEVQAERLHPEMVEAAQMDADREKMLDELLAIPREGDEQ